MLSNLILNHNYQILQWITIPTNIHSKGANMLCRLGTNFTQLKWMLKTWDYVCLCVSNKCNSNFILQQFVERPALTVANVSSLTSANARLALLAAPANRTAMSVRNINRVTSIASTPSDRITASAEKASCCCRIGRAASEWRAIRMRSRLAIWRTMWIWIIRTRYGILKV